MEKSNVTTAKSPTAGAPTPAKTSNPGSRRAKIPPFFRRIDWLTLGIVTLVVFIAYALTLAPEVTLEDSGELATGSFYAGIPHPPGYPVWTIYTFFWSILLPFGNVAWRVAMGEAFAGAAACGVMALMVSRGSSMFLESVAALKDISRRWESALSMVAGLVSGLLLGFNGFLWSQSVIVEVYSFSLLSFMATLCFMLRWAYAPTQRRYLYLAFFMFGICFTNHQTLLLAAMGLEVMVIAVDKRIGRDLLMWNSILFVVGYVATKYGMIPSFETNKNLFVIFNGVGLGSVAGFLWLTFITRKTVQDWIALTCDLLLVGCFGYILALIGFATELLPPLEPHSSAFLLIHLGGWSFLALCGWLVWISPKRQDLKFGRYYKAAAATAIVFALSLIVVSAGGFSFLKSSLWSFWAYMFPCILVLLTYFWLTTRQREVGGDLKIAFMLAFMWILGAGFYLYMPVAGMTCPPMQWGYPRTVEGFFHALTRGQYEAAHPMDLTDIPHDFLELFILGKGIVTEFNWVYALLALVPFIFFLRLQKRERSWIIGLVGVFLFMSVLLIIMLNPSPDRQSIEMNRVFFTAAHAIVAMFMGYGITLICAEMLLNQERMRSWVMIGSIVAIGLALVDIYGQTRSLYGVHPDMSSIQIFFDGIGRSFHKNQYGLPIFAGLLLLGMAVAFLVNVLMVRGKTQVMVALAVFSIMPLYSVMNNWFDNEQRNHYFGYWFGHDMFTPPVQDKSGKLTYDPEVRKQQLNGPDAKMVYPEMAYNAILFGGTDPGRFCPTYMIFCDSFIPDRCKPVFDQKFDRRDVYLITQNALADGTYLDYIRSQYFPSAQHDPPFFMNLLRTQQEKSDNYNTNFVAQLAYDALDKPFLSLGNSIDQRRRKNGVYPFPEIYTPSPEDSQQCFQDYIADAQRRLMHDEQHPNEPKQVRPGEGITFQGGKVQVSGQVAVMAINGLLTKVIFDHNPTNEFYVEESFPLEWMYPHLTPYGIIMKINRQTVPELSEDVLKRDHEFWSTYSERLIGNWITYDTSIKDIVAFIEKVYLRHDFNGFKGDLKFVRDDDAQKAFSKLRSSIAGIYAWRLGMSGGGPTPPQYMPKSEAERQRLIREADFAFRQAFAFCPYSPEAVFRYVNLLLGTGRLDDALLVAKTCHELDPDNPAVVGLVNQLEGYKNGPRPQPQPQAAAQTPAQIQSDITQLEGEVRANPTDFQKAFDLAAKYIQIQQTNRAEAILNGILNNPQAQVNAVLAVAQAYASMNNLSGLEAALEKLVKLEPNQPEAWYDLAASRAVMGKTNESLKDLQQAVTLSNQRLTTNAQARDLRTAAAADQRFGALKTNAEFKSLIAK